MPESAFKEAAPDTWSVEREKLLSRKIADLGLKIEGSRLEPIVARLYAELHAAGIDFEPKVYLSDEWSCPDSVPVIGVPFYLVDPQLSRIEDEMMDGIEAEADDTILRYLRHEAGHAINYAYKLYESPEWLQTFGSFRAPYHDEYKPIPFSRNYVRHIPGWYAQKHPDEDFSESFAVWLDPHSDWRHVYDGWGCYAKLLYVEHTIARIGHSSPLVTGNDYDFASEDVGRLSVAEHYRHTRPNLPVIATDLDSELREVFRCPEGRQHGPDSVSVPALLHERRRSIVGSATYWTGLYDVHVRALMTHLTERSKELELCVKRDQTTEALIRFTTLFTALCMNRLLKGDFVIKDGSK